MFSPAVAFASAAVVLAGCSSDHALADECAPLAEGIRVVAHNGGAEVADPAPGLTELWRAGGLNDGQDLAAPVAVAASRSGYSAVADFMLGEVIVIAPDGTWLGAWGRRGSGPGELRMPVAVAWDDDNTLSVLDVERAMIVHLRNGEPARSDDAVEPALLIPILMSGQLEWAGVLPNGVALVHGVPSEPDEDGRSLRAIVRSRPGRALDTIVSAAVPVVLEGPFRGWPLPGWPRPVVGLGGGRMAVGATDGTYRVLVHDDAGSPLHQVCGSAAGTPVSPAERGSGVAGEWSQPLADAFASAAVPVTPAPFGRLMNGADGRLYVQRGRPNAFIGHDALHGVAGATFDVFDSDGAYLTTFRAPPRARIHTAAGDTLWAIEFGEFDEAWIIAYRLER